MTHSFCSSIAESAIAYMTVIKERVGVTCHDTFLTSFPGEDFDANGMISFLDNPIYG